MKKVVNHYCPYHQLPITSAAHYNRIYSTDFYSHCLVFSVGWHDLCNGDDHLMIAMKNTADSGSVNVVCGVNIMSSCFMFAVVLILTPHSHKHSWSLNTSDCLDVGKCLMSAYFIIGHQTPPVAAVPLLILIFLTHGSYGL